MTRAERRLDDYLGHILEAIERIDRYVDGLDERAFLNNQLVQDAVTRNFEIIGEASNNIEKHHPDFAAAHPGEWTSSRRAQRHGDPHDPGRYPIQLRRRPLSTDGQDRRAAVRGGLHAQTGRDTHHLGAQSQSTRAPAL